VFGLEFAETLPQIVFTADASGRFEWCNGRWYAFTGTARNGIAPGDAWFAAIHPDDRSTAVAAWNDGIAAQAAFVRRLRLRGASGAYRWFLVRAARTEGGEGPAHWIGTCTDIDEEHRRGESVAFLAQAGEILSESLDLQTTLDRLLGIIVPELADWAAIDLFDADGRLETVAAVHADPAKAALVSRLCGRHTHARQFDRDVGAALRTRAARVIPDVGEDLLRSAAAPEMLPIILALRPHSTVTVPLRSRGTTLGSFVAYWAESQRRYGDEDVPLFAELAKRAAVSIDNARLYERERIIAATFQRAALPAALPQVDGLRFDVVYQSGTDEALVGGDWYDAVRLTDGRVVVSIGDVAGSGLPAAVVMAAMRQVIQGVAQVYADPSAMLEAADRTLKSEYPNTFVTAFVAVFDRVAQTVSYASAGHLPPLVRRFDGRVETLRHGGLPLGLGMRGEIATTFAATHDGMTFVFYTDGVVEMNRDLAAGQLRLEERLTAAVDEPDLAHAIFSDVCAGGCHDDAVILTVTLDDSRSGMRLGFDASDGEAAHAAREAFVVELGRWGIAPHDTFAAELVFGELIGNVARYAPGYAEVVLDLGGEIPVLHVLDRGPGFNLVPRLPTDLLSERGRGLFLVWSMTEDVNVTRRPDGGSHARAALAVSRPGAYALRAMKAPTRGAIC